MPRLLWESTSNVRKKGVVHGHADERARTRVWDIAHANSLEEMDDGSILISLRILSQLVKIHRDTGEIIWRLGGRGANFRIIGDPRGTFIGQHDGRDIGDNKITLFDNHYRIGIGTARAVDYQLEVNATQKIARLVSSFNSGLPSYAIGGYRRLSNANRAISLGFQMKSGYSRGNPFYLEVTDEGESVVEMQFASRNLWAYRTIKAPWIGTPAWPSTALLDDNNKAKTLRLHFSWNGDTRTQKWRIFMGQYDKPVTVVYAEVERKQFEHWVDVPEGAEKCQYFQAVALDAEGKQMSRSSTVETKPCG